MRLVNRILKSVFQVERNQVLKLDWIDKFNNNFDPPYANCWALTMMICGALDEPKWARLEEVEQWLATCTHAYEGEPRPGDIFVMRSHRNHGRIHCIEHTAMYLGNGTYWHKPGSDVGQYTTLEQMQYIYHDAPITEYVRLNSAKDIDIAQKIDRQISSLLKDAA